MKTCLTSIVAVLAIVGCSIANAMDSGTTESKATGHEALKVPHEGYSAMRAIHLARIAIFDGQPELAVERLTHAKNDLKAAMKDTTKYVIDVQAFNADKKVREKTITMEKNWIPIDGKIMLADSFVVTPENAKHIAAANEHLKKGEFKKGIEALRQGMINVSFSRVMMPLNMTMEGVDEALNLIGEHKYYEANLVLKVAEEDTVTETVSLIAVPEAHAKKAKASKP